MSTSNSAENPPANFTDTTTSSSTSQSSTSSSSSSSSSSAPSNSSTTNRSYTVQVDTAGDTIEGNQSSMIQLINRLQPRQVGGLMQLGSDDQDLHWFELGRPYQHKREIHDGSRKVKLVVKGENGRFAGPPR